MVQLGRVEGELVAVVHKHRARANRVVLVAHATGETHRCPGGRAGNRGVQGRILPPRQPEYGPVLAAAILRVVANALAPKETKIALGKCADLRGGHRHLHSLGVTEHAVVGDALGVVIAHLGAALVRRHLGPARVSSHGRDVDAPPAEQRLLCQDELVLHVPEAARAKVQLNQRVRRHRANWAHRESRWRQQRAEQRQQGSPTPARKPARLGAAGFRCGA
mmetsp:Transcript_26962/g.87099  ORF Transcript_26962/g.87099 Transcript_26962/m.87099 type:complete len:220 (-) Transcript_26962:139-798(-)|eukprot:scaffold4756_cov116-Isochrysis_galbana.AAC.7